MSIIALVEDDESTGSAAREILQRSGFDVVWVKSSADAYELIADQENHIDAIVLDLNLAGERGETLIKRCEALRVLPPTMVITSGEPAEDCAFAMLDLGAAACLRKPYTADELIEALKQSLQPEPTELPVEE